ncbi:MAG: Mitochondrial carrier [Aureobasidium pullulans]|nr:MAG: Mitochondrial carrier [Aureobasidium pullulans]
MISPNIVLIALSITTANALIQSAENSTSLNCATGAHIQALGFTFEYMNANNTDTGINLPEMPIEYADNLSLCVPTCNNTDTGINLPEMPIEYADNPSLCVPTSLFDSYFEAIEAQAKLLDIQSDNGLSLISRAPKPDHVFLDKRARNCRQLKEAQISSIHKYSCSSAPHADKCRSCANWATGSFATSIAACGLKEQPAEAVSCCASAALAFGTYYTQVCLEK